LSKSLYFNSQPLIKYSRSLKKAGSNEIKDIDTGAGARELIS
jgi:hypothetical protein